MTAIDHDALEAAIRADREAGTKRTSNLLETASYMQVADAILKGPDVAANARRIHRTFALEAAFLASREEARQLRAERERLRGIIARVEGDSERLDRLYADLSPTFDQRDPGDETPERPRPRRDGPGLDVKALAYHPHANMPDDSRN
jgi:hypothetical protein